MAYPDVLCLDDSEFCSDDDYTTRLDLRAATHDGVAAYMSLTKGGAETYIYLSRWELTEIHDWCAARLAESEKPTEPAPTPIPTMRNLVWAAAFAARLAYLPDISKETLVSRQGQAYSAKQWADRIAQAFDLLEAP